MSEEVKLKEYIDGLIKEGGIVKFGIADLARKVLEIESIKDYFNLMLGVELSITVKPITPPEGRFYGKGLADELIKLRNDKQ